MKISWPYNGMKTLDVLNTLIDYAARYGILIMLDIHRVRHDLGISELWHLSLFFFSFFFSFLLSLSFLFFLFSFSFFFFFSFSFSFSFLLETEENKTSRYDEGYGTDRVKSVMQTLMRYYSGKWNVFAIDLKNEPHGKATWGNNDPSLDWRLAAEDFANLIIGFPFSFSLSLSFSLFL